MRRSTDWFYSGVSAAFSDSTSSYWKLNCFFVDCYVDGRHVLGEIL